MVAMSLPPWRLIRGQDVVWLLLFTALALFSSNPTPMEIGLVLCLGAFQLLKAGLSGLRCVAECSSQFF